MKKLTKSTTILGKRSRDAFQSASPSLNISDHPLQEGTTVGENLDTQLTNVQQKESIVRESVTRIIPIAHNKWQIGNIILPTDDYTVMGTCITRTQDRPPESSKNPTEDFKGDATNEEANQKDDQDDVIGASSHEQPVFHAYADLGDSSYECEFCGALFWYEERVRKSPAGKPPKFSPCCNQGDVVLPAMEEPPEPLKSLIFGSDERSRHFLENIRSYNAMFAFTSMGGKQDKDINQGKTPPIFRINGQNYHRIGSLLPRDGGQPKFLQMYLCDPSEETSNRLKAVRSEGGTKLHDALVSELTHMLDTYNVHAQSFRMARDRFNASNSTTLKMRLIGKRSSDGRTYTTPSVSEVAALIEGGFDVNRKERDVVLQTKSGAFQFVTELNPSFLGLQYPLLFPYGQDGFRDDVLLTREIEDSNYNGGRKFATMKDFFHTGCRNAKVKPHIY
ncbi:unnamed protein product [Cuscuta epithymum]|uniref:Helitron helicase-like domain-containing protein n=1 Tax=Cuscuta epithymum TaxID=186058 RepID=A0AAV0FPJ5_9ASTE|nr:unnamed protein product [Cuscuta epithymum]